MPFQREGTRRLVNGRRGVILADEMGLGKTTQAICALQELNAKNVLIVCPKTVISVWESELAKWLDGPRRWTTVTSTSRKRWVSDQGEDGRSGEQDDDILIINYEMVSKLRAELDRRAPFDVLIADEAHYLKSPDTIRTKALLGDTMKPRQLAGEEGVSARRTWLLTGTPCLNHPLDLFPLLKAIDPRADVVPHLFSYYGFRRRFCEETKNSWGSTWGGVRNEAELHRHLFSDGLMLRRTREQVIPELIEFTETNPSPKSRELVSFTSAEASRLEEEAIAEALEQHDGGPSAPFSGRAEFRQLALGDTGFGEGQSWRDLRFSDIMRLRNASARAKVPFAVKHVAALAQTKKVVVFAHHVDVVASLAAAFGDAAAVRMTGETRMDARAQAIERFQQDDATRIFVCTTRSAGQGITLTAASAVVFVEFDWSPAVMAQAEDRVHRIGQHLPVTVQYLFLTGTLDEHVCRVLARKLEHTRSVLGAPQAAAPHNVMPSLTLQQSGAELAQSGAELETHLAQLEATAVEVAREQSDAERAVHDLQAAELVQAAWMVEAEEAGLVEAEEAGSVEAAAADMAAGLHHEAELRAAEEERLRQVLQKAAEVAKEKNAAAASLDALQDNDARLRQRIEKLSREEERVSSRLKRAASKLAHARRRMESLAESELEVKAALGELRDRSPAAVARALEDDFDFGDPEIARAAGSLLDDDVAAPAAAAAPAAVPAAAPASKRTRNKQPSKG